MTCAPLTFEQTRGTKTFYLPFGWGQAPEITVMIKRANDGHLHVGLAVCSQEDNFSRRMGRRIAFHRLAGKPLVFSNSDELVNELRMRFDALTSNRPRTLSVVTFQDLDRLRGVEAAFDILDENRDRRVARVAGAEITAG